MRQSKSPLRYPGGKQKVTPFIEQLLLANEITGHYVEPYAGGAGLGINLLLSRKVNHIHLNDVSVGIYAFWHSVLNATDELCNLISSASLTVEEWRQRQQIVKNERENLLQLGFSTFYLNRCNRSGVLSAGVIGGLDQTGNYKMGARFNRVGLITRIEAIAAFRDQISVTNLDAEYYIQNYIPNLPQDTLIYFDPPYYEKGSELYPNYYRKEDHERLANLIQEGVDHRWVLSYDGVNEILDLYQDRRYFLYDLQYNAARVYKGKEVFVFCDRITLPSVCNVQCIDAGIANLVNG